MYSSVEGGAGEAAAPGQEFDLDAMTTVAALNDLSRDIGGPAFDAAVDLEAAKAMLWDFVEETAEDDVDEMCLGELAGRMLQLTGRELGDVGLEEAREVVRAAAREGEGGDRECPGCPTCQGGDGTAIQVTS